MSKTFKTIAALNVRSGPGVLYDSLDVLDKGDVIQEVGLPENWCPIGMEDATIGWVSRNYLVEVTETPEAPVLPPITPVSGEPVWIQWARKQIGQKEVPGPASNPVIQAWYHLTTLPEYLWTDATAWCAVFVNAALMLNNIKTNRSARAFDWLTWGKPVLDPQKGDVVVFDFSHVAFYLNDAGGGRIACLGGNQNDSVTITSFDKASVRGYRRAA